MRILLTTILLALATIASAQITYTADPSFRRIVGHLEVDRGFAPTRTCGAPVAPPVSLNRRPRGYMTIDTCAHLVYIYNGSSWQVATGPGSFDSSSLSQRINERVRYTDTAAMLAPYLPKADTAAMLEGYQRLGLQFFQLPDVDSNGIQQDDIPFYDAATRRVYFRSFPDIFDITDVPSGLKYVGTLVPTSGSLISLGYADLRYAQLSGSYANPSWISSLDWAKITGRPTTLSGYGITDGVATSGSYANPSWVTSLAWGKLTGVPSSFTPSAHSHPLSDLSQSGATSGQVPQWNGSAWVPATVSGGGGPIDTFLISTKGNVRKVADSLAHLIRNPIIRQAALAGLTIYGLPVVRNPFDIEAASNLVDNRADVTLMEIEKAGTVTGVGYYLATAGSYTADQTNSIALFKIEGNSMTLVAETANSSSIYTGTANQWRQANFSSTYNAEPGLYMVSFLYNQSTQTTAPQIGGFNLTNAAASGSQGTLFANNIKTAGAISGRNTQPATQALSGVGGINTVRLCYVY